MFSITLNNLDKIAYQARIKCIFTKYYKSLVTYAGTFVSFKEAEDVVQDIFITLIEKKPTFLEEYPQAYLYKAVRNRCFNVLKHSKIKEDHCDNAMKLLRDDNLFLKEVLNQEIARQLYTAIEVLSDRKKEIIKLSLMGMKNSDIAERLSIKLSTVKNLKSQAYQILRKQFKNDENLLYFLLFSDL